jgi:hypothetical protein
MAPMSDSEKSARKRRKQRADKLCTIFNLANPTTAYEFMAMQIANNRAIGNFSIQFATDFTDRVKQFDPVQGDRYLVQDMLLAWRDVGGIAGDH